MESFSFNFTYQDSMNFLVQVISLKDSFFVYVGTSDLNFDNLIVSLSKDKNVLTKTIIDDEYSEMGRNMSENLIYLSFNVPDEFMVTARDAYMELEGIIYKKLKQIN